MITTKRVCIAIMLVGAAYLFGLWYESLHRVNQKDLKILLAVLAVLIPFIWLVISAIRKAKIAGLIFRFLSVLLVAAMVILIAFKLGHVTPGGILVAMIFFSTKGWIMREPVEEEP